MNKRQMLYNIIIVVMVIIFLLLVAIGLIRSARIIRVDANAFAKGREETETETTTVTESETEKTTVAESGMTTMTASIDKMKENDSGKRIALTFDDGPHPCYTEQLLDGLKERGVVATFFVIGESAAKHPDLVQRMAKEGHLIGNHTYTHIQLCDENVETFEKELLQTNELLRELTGQDTQYVRPPFGT